MDRFIIFCFTLSSFLKPLNAKNCDQLTAYARFCQVGCHDGDIDPEACLKALQTRASIEGIDPPIVPSNYWQVNVICEDGSGRNQHNCIDMLPLIEGATEEYHALPGTVLKMSSLQPALPDGVKWKTIARTEFWKHKFEANSNYDFIILKKTPDEMRYFKTGTIVRTTGSTGSISIHFDPTPAGAAECGHTSMLTTKERILAHLQRDVVEKREGTSPGLFMWGGMFRTLENGKLKEIDNGSGHIKPLSTRSFTVRKAWGIQLLHFIDISAAIARSVAADEILDVYEGRDDEDSYYDDDDAGRYYKLYRLYRYQQGLLPPRLVRKPSKRFKYDYYY